MRCFSSALSCGPLALTFRTPDGRTQRTCSTRSRTLFGRSRLLGLWDSGSAPSCTSSCVAADFCLYGSKTDADPDLACTFFLFVFFSFSGQHLVLCRRHHSRIEGLGRYWSVRKTLRETPATSADALHPRFHLPALTYLHDNFLPSCWLSITVASFYFKVVFGETAQRALRYLTPTSRRRAQLADFVLSSVFVALSALGNVMSVTFAQSRVNQGAFSPALRLTRDVDSAPFPELGKEGFLPFTKFWASNWPVGAPLPGLIVHLIPSVVIILGPPAAVAYPFILGPSFLSRRSSTPPLNPPRAFPKQTSKVTRARSSTSSSLWDSCGFGSSAPTSCGPSACGSLSRSSSSSVSKTDFLLLSQ